MNIFMISISVMSLIYTLFGVLPVVNYMIRSRAFFGKPFDKIYDDNHG